jgi:polyhydroxyalkanoate synthesis regulator phasin
MQEALRTYLELAMGLTEASRKKVKKVVKDAAGRGGATAEQLKTLTTDLMATNSANREALAKLVKFEVDRALGVVGLATADEVGDLTSRVRDLEQQLREAEGRTVSSGNGAGPAKATTKAGAPVKKTAKKTAAANNTAAKKTGAKNTAAKKTGAKKTGARKTAAATTGAATTTSAAPAKRTAAKKTATRSPATKAAAKTARKAARKSAAAGTTTGAQA